MIIIIRTTLLCFVAISFQAIAAELQHSFNSPSFSGVGYSSHVLTIKQLEDNQRDKNKAAADAMAAKVAAEAASTPQAQFVANIQSRVYAQLAKQITDSLFGTNGVTSCASLSPYTQCGEMSIGGNDITWRLGDPSKPSESGMVIVNIVGTTGSTQIKVPSGTFNF